VVLAPITLLSITTAERADKSATWISELHTNCPGSGGQFVLDKTSTRTVNGGTVLATDTGTGRWLRVFSGPLDIRWFGAKANVTSNQAPYINAALAVDFWTDGVWDYAPSTVLIPRGYWWLSEPVKLYRGSILMGEGDWDGGGSVLTMLAGSNCSAIQTPTAHSGRTATQFMKVLNLHVVGNLANQTVEAPAIDWRGAFVGSMLDYIMVSDWLGPAIVCGSSSDTHISRIWIIGIKTDSYAMQCNQVGQTGNNGFLMLTDIYIEQVQKRNGAKGKGLLLSHLVSVDLRGFHTENIGCPLTLDSCHSVTIQGFNSWLDGYGTEVGTGVANSAGELAVSAIIYFLGGCYLIDIGPIGRGSTEANTLFWRNSPGVTSSTFPRLTGMESKAAWGGFHWVNTEVSEGLEMDVWGVQHLFRLAVVGNLPNQHPEILMKKNAHVAGDYFSKQYRVDYNFVIESSNIGGVDRPHFRFGAYGGGFATQFFDPLVLADSASLPDDNMFGRSGSNLLLRTGGVTRNVPQFTLSASAPVDGTTPGLLGEEIIVNETDVYKCVRVTPSRWKKLSP
jgi:hypothetical protein